MVAAQGEWMLNALSADFKSLPNNCGSKPLSRPPRALLRPTGTLEVCNDVLNWLNASAA